MGRTFSASSILAAALLAAATVQAASDDDRFADVEVTPQRVSGNVYILTGAGGNIGATVGRDGTLIIDDQFEALTPKIIRALNSIDGDAPKIVLNTHFHGDHTGGNPVFGETGTIVAHDNVRLRLTDEEGFPARGLPVVTYADRVTVHFNDDTLEVIHMPAAHTDGDSIVWFQEAKVLHTGDLLFHGTFPFIDLENGGSVTGVIDNLRRIIEMVPDDAQVIPGHGPLATPEDIRETLAMIEATREEVMEALDTGMNVDEVVAEGLDSRWESWGQGFINEERWIRTLAAGANDG